MGRLGRSALWLAALAALAGGCGSGSARHPAASSNTHGYRSHVPSVWPPLPTTGFIRGRVATAADVAAGNAVFAACVGVAGSPLPVAIPQYALWHDSATDSVKPVVVVEAELFDGDSMFGLRQIPGGADAMARAGDLELLGQTPPSPAGRRPDVPHGTRSRSATKRVPHPELAL